MDDIDRFALKVIWMFTFAFGSAFIIMSAVEYGVIGALLATGMLAFMAILFSLAMLAPSDP